jgi:hypothetical protein
MTKKLPLIILTILLHTALQGFAQIVVTFPSTRAVFQRDNANAANVYIGGFTTEPFESVEARFVPRIAGEGEPSPTDGSWLTIDAALEAGHFYGSMTVKGGWYNLEVRGRKQNGTTQATMVERVGVGEVFVVAGQSNATGGDANPNGPGAQHDQVNSVNFQNLDSTNFTSYSYSATQLPCPQYVHLDAGVKTAPFGNYAWCWGSFGDKLYEKLRVPVMIFNAGWSSSGIDNWKQSIDPNFQTISAFGYTFPAGQPFGHLRRALNYYAAQLGVRAVLWHQGETDNYLEQPADSTYNNYVSAMGDVINATRNLTGKNNLAWLVARASRFTVGGVSRVSASVVNAQNEIINNDAAYPHVYAGPETDPYYTVEYRADEVHFRGDGINASPDGNVYSGLLHLAGFWVDKIDNAFLSQSTPYPALAPPAVSAAYTSGGTQVTFTGPGLLPGGQYKWLGTDCNNVQSTAQNWTVGTGSYKLKIVDEHNNTIFSPQLFVAGSALPVTWKAFTAKVSPYGRSIIEWSTGSEIHTSHFDIERSTDALKFEVVKSVNAAGESKSEISYQYQDEYLPSGTYYYRLKQVDVDGKFEYTRIENVRINGNMSARAYPNPVTDKLTIEGVEPLGLVEVFDAAGIRRYTFDTQLKNVQVDMQGFPGGLYTVTINGKSFKVVK